MNKIVVKDDDKDVHVFKGEDLGYAVDQTSQSCEIIRFSGDTSNRTSRRIAFFSKIKWVKDQDATESDVEKSITNPIPEPVETPVDKFTQKELDESDPLERVDFNILKSETPVPGVEAQKNEKPPKSTGKSKPKTP